MPPVCPRARNVVEMLRSWYRCYNVGISEVENLSRKVQQPYSRGGNRKKPGGGTAAGGGINFQAAVTAIAGAHMLRGTPIGWLPVPDIPIAVLAESEGAGDDLRLELTTNQHAEVQAKKGLTRSKVWDALIGIVIAVRDGEFDYGLLAIAPDSSSTVREDLANDLQRLAQGRTDHLTDIGTELHRRLNTVGGDWASACKRVTIRVVHALETDGADIRATKEVLRTVCSNDSDADAAWNALYQDAVLRIEHRGRWSTSYLVAVLAKAGIAIRDGESRAATARRLVDWVKASNASFTLPTIRKALPLDRLLEMRTLCTTAEQPDAENIAMALTRYNSAIDVRERDTKVFDAEWTGQFKRHAVVVAGPGLGKSTLMTMLAGRYASEGLPVLVVRLKAIAAALKSGIGFDHALCQQALDGSGITAEQFDRANLQDLIVLADGLDDCGEGHDMVARSLKVFALGHPTARVIVTTRPIGYSTAAFADWQHYQLLPPDKSQGIANLYKLLNALEVAAGREEADELFNLAERELSHSRAAETISASPLLLGMAAAVIHNKGKLPDTRPILYAALVGLFETSRRGAVPWPVARAVATRVLDSLGWSLMRNPLAPAELVITQLAEQHAASLGKTPLATIEDIEKALVYWEKLGIIEQVHHDGIAYWTFIHKSFSEFVAARYLVALPNMERAYELDRLIDDPAWNEVVSFSSGLGLSEEIFSLFVARRAAGHPGQLERALRLAADRDAAVSIGQVQNLAELAFKAIEVSEKDPFDIGVALVELAKANSAAIVPLAATRRDCAQPEIQLIAWACLATAASSEQEAVELTSRLDALLPTISWPLRPSLLGGLRLGRCKDRDLIQQIALAVLGALPKPDVQAFVNTYLTHQTFDSISFQSRVTRILRERGCDHEVELPWQNETSLSLLKLMKPSEEWRTASQRALLALVKAATHDGETPTGAGAPVRFPNLAALYDIANCGNVPAYDVYRWNTPFDSAALRLIVRAVVSASTIDPQALSREAAAAICQIEATENFTRFEFDLPSVDVPEPDWAKAAGNIPDRGILVSAMNHGSDWLTYLAGSILAASPSTADQSRALLDVNGASLWAATQVVRDQQPRNLANELILDRLSHPLPDGAEHLFLGLEAGGIDQSPKVSAAIRHGLESSHNRVAEAAANLAKALTDRQQPTPAIILQEAYDRWTAAESGTRSNVIPPSPRAVLLKLLIAQAALGEERLLAALSDMRSDVRAAAMEHLPVVIFSSASFRDAVAEAIVSHAVSPRIALTTLDVRPPFSAAQIAMLKGLLNDPSPTWRRAGIGLLRSEYLSADEIAKFAGQLANDAEEEIRTAAAHQVGRSVKELIKALSSPVGPVIDLS